MRQTIERNTEGFSESDINAVETSLLFIRTAKRVFDALDGHLGRAGLSHGRFGLLMQLELSGGELSPGDLADTMGVSRATITGLLDRLERDGLVERSANASDRRMQVIRMTGAGRKQLQAALPQHVRRLAELLSGLDADERRRLRTLLARIAHRAQAMR